MCALPGFLKSFSFLQIIALPTKALEKSESFILIYLLCFVFVIMMTCFNLFPNFFKIEKNHSLKNRVNREENEIYVSESHKSRRERDFFPQNLTNREENEIYFSKSHKSRREREFSLKIFIIENRKRNENSIFSSERERERSVFLEISRDSRLLLMPACLYVSFPLFRCEMKNNMTKGTYIKSYQYDSKSQRNPSQPIPFQLVLHQTTKNVFVLQ